MFVVTPALELTPQIQQILISNHPFDSPPVEPRDPTAMSTSAAKYLPLLHSAERLEAMPVMNTIALDAEALKTEIDPMPHGYTD